MKAIINFFDNHLTRILRELKEQGISISNESILRIIEATSFKNRSRKYPEKCPCYPESHCYESYGNIENPSCFLCGCPEYRIDLNKRPVTRCNLRKYYQLGGTGGYYIPYSGSPDGQIWACEKCPHPYYKETVEKFLKENLDDLKRRYEEL
ncbi:hypothetical protein GF386_05550 [Candidatus Pacearchaeota archaeon]|nr:hypothetical protein [Candidatus Pacearchaeota archaeon]MBD3283565.1 hypothetical protein [Candidatus Pacearchaeota archaeon]